MKMRKKKSPITGGVLIPFCSVVSCVLPSIDVWGFNRSNPGWL
jgi:hypothetical protein